MVIDENALMESIYAFKRQSGRFPERGYCSGEMSMALRARVDAIKDNPPDENGHLPVGVHACGVPFFIDRALQGAELRFEAAAAADSNSSRCQPHI